MSGQAGSLPGWFSLPTEIAKIILHVAFDASSFPLTTKNRNLDRVTLIIARFVCHQWKDLLSPFSPSCGSPLLSSCHFVAEIAGRGWMSGLQWARKQGSPWNELACAQGARGGHLDIVKWLREQGCHWDSSTADGAAGGHLDLLKWARKEGCPWHTSTFRDAAKGAHLDVMEWLWENECPFNRADMNPTLTVLGDDNLELVKWMHERDMLLMNPPGPNPGEHAASGGHLEMLKWLEGYAGCSLNNQMWDRAAYSLLLQKGVRT